MKLAELQQAGFNQQEIDDYVSKERTRLSNAGFNENEIGEYLGEPVKTQAGIGTIADPQDVNFRDNLPKFFNDTDKDKLETASILADEFGINNETAISTYDILVYNRYGRTLSPTEVKRRLTQEGIYVDSEQRKLDVFSIADSVVNNKPIDNTAKARIRTYDLNKQIQELKTAFDSQNEYVAQNFLYQATTTAKPSMPNTVFAETDLQAGIEDNPEQLLDFDTFISLVNDAPSMEVVQSLLDKRNDVFKNAIRDQKTLALKNIRTAIAMSQPVTAFGEFSKGFKKGVANVVGGLSGVVSDLTGDLQPGFENLRQSAKEYQKKPELQEAKDRTTAQYLAGNLGQALPYFLSAMVGGQVGGLAFASKAGAIVGSATTAFAAEGESAYQTALDNGATETEAQIERAIVGTINAAIETLQIEKIFKFSKGATRQGLVQLIKQKAYREAAKTGGKLTLDALKLSVSEGLEEALQEGVSIGTPALLRGDYAKLENGKPDWWTIAAQVNGAYWGGASAGVMLGGIGKGITAYKTGKLRNDLATGISLFENMNFGQAKAMANELIERTANQPETYEDVYNELLGKYSPVQRAFDDMMEKNAEGIIEPEQPEGLGEEYFDANKEKLKPSKTTTTVDVVKNVGKQIDKALGSMSTRLENINPVLKYRVRKTVHTVNMRTAKYTNAVLDFFEAAESIEKQNAGDYRKLELSIFNGSENDIDNIVQTYGIQKQYNKYRKAMDEIFTLAQQVGIDIDYLNTYFHRKVIDFDGLIRHLETTENWSVIQQALSEAESARGNRGLTDTEKTHIINSLLRGFSSNRLFLSKPGAAKERTIGIIDNEIEKFYASWREGVMDYISSMSKAITYREFFGKQSDELVDLRSRISRLKTRIHKLQTGQVAAKDKEDSVKNTQIELKRTQDEYDKKNSKILEDSIGSYVKDLVDDGTINWKQQKEIKDILDAIFNPKPIGKYVGKIVKMAYIDTLAQIPNAITQLGELGLSVMRAPDSALSPIARSFLKQSKVKMEDVYLHEIGEEWTDKTFSKFGNAMLFMLEQTDKLGKEAYINTVIDKYRKQALSSPDKLEEKLSVIFGNDTDTVIKELANGEVSENIKLLAFNELADIQPIAISEMPEYYAKAGNMRVFYMFRTFTIKRLDMIRRECFSLMSNPIKRPQDFLKGFARLIWMGFILLASDTAADVIKDWFKGKEINITDNVIDNFWQNTLIFNRYAFAKAKSEGIGGTFQKIFPTKSIDAAWKDIYNFSKSKYDRTYQGSELVRSVPIIGEPYYWWFGKGKEKLDMEQNSGAGRF